MARAVLTSSLEAKVQHSGDVVRMLRDSPSGRFHFPYPDEYTTWQDEQAAWTETAVLFDQSHHMTDVYFTGPDVVQLLTDTGTNSFQGFGRNRAKHFVACTDAGQIIGTAVLFGLERDQVSLVGPAAAANWVQYQAETGGYDVEIVRDERSADKPGQPRLTFRYEIEGPTAWQIVEKAHGRPLERIPFFRMGDITLGGRPVRALVHTMVGVPGAETMGLELQGDAADGPACLEALLAAGEEYGLLRGGALAYYTGSLEAGYLAQPVPAIYTGEQLKQYREWLPADGYEGKLSIGGSFRSERIEDYYVTPWEFGYEHLVKFDHDFIGRDALQERAKEPPMKKVWLRWNDADATRVYASSLFANGDRAKFLSTPLARYARVMCDAIERDGRRIGIANMAGYTVNIGSWASIGMVDAAEAQDGAEVEIIWGEENGGTRKLTVERHAQTRVRATVSTRPLR